MSWLSTFIDSVEKASTTVLTGAETIAPVAAVVPGGAAIVTGVEGVATALATGLAAARAALAADTPEIQAVEAFFSTYLHLNLTPGAVVVTPIVSIGTTLAKPPTAEATAAMTAVLQ